MVKSFKKVLACILSVLMVATMLPMTVFAAPGDYEPNITLQFGTLYDTGASSGSWTNVGTGSVGVNFDGCGIYDVKLTPTTKKNKDGSLSLKKLMLEKEQADYASSILGCDTIDADYTYGVGDCFTVTIIGENLESACVLQTVLTYSDNIEPVGLYKYKSSRNGYSYVIGTETERLAQIGTDKLVATWVEAGTKPIAKQSAFGIYDASWGPAEDDTSYVNTENHYMNSALVSRTGAREDTTVCESTDPSVPFTNPETGNMDGYSYTNAVIMSTFAFKIVGEGDINFGVWDTDNTKHSEGNYSGGYLIADPADGKKNEQYTSYAVCTDADTHTIVGPGAMKFTIFGMNVNSGVGIPGDEPVEEPHVHNYSSVVTPPNCTEKGYTTYTCDNADGKCDNVTYVDDYVDELKHDMQVVEGTAKAPTCTVPGKEADKACSRCDYKETGKTLPATNIHDYSVVVEGTAIPETCAQPGKEADMKCSTCDKVETGAPIPATNKHTPVSANNKVDPTPAKDGHEADTICDVCKQTLEAGAVIPALGVNVTIADTHKSYGSVDVAWGVNNVEYGSTVTVTATPLEECDFVGYEVAGKLVSTDPTYTYVAYKDITITPVFVPHAEDTITVIFYDKYSNVVASFVDVTVEEFQNAMASAIPQAPTYAGYTFTGWSLTEAQIKALDQSTTVWAYYAEVKDELFTVKTTEDSTLTVNRGTMVTPTEYKVTFDTKATVYNKDATAWTVDGTIVGYGDTYEFYVGSDITVEPVFASVEAKATVTMIKNYLIQEGSHKVMFLASMNVPDGFTLVDHGFVYGKNLADADMTLENVGNTGTLAGAGAVKVTSAGTSPVEQFGISYGIKAKTGKACAKAFLTFVKDGELQTIYSDAVEYVY